MTTAALFLKLKSRRNPHHSNSRIPAQHSYRQSLVRSKYKTLASGYCPREISSPSLRHVGDSGTFACPCNGNRTIFVPILADRNLTPTCGIRTSRA
ncbi:hypothetical protein PM082_005142 [Marasmius tenuissimus]|nr:hypothetical protein PM082_005142 [Marasmius tenuissimus]